MRTTFHPLAILLGLLLFAAQLIGQDQSSDSAKSTTQARKPVQQHRFTEAAIAAEAEGEEFLFRKHDAKGAIESFKKSIKLDPWYTHGYIMLGVANTQAQRWGDAQWAFEEASKLEPEDVQAWLGIGSALNEQKDYAGAQKALEHCLDLNPDSAEAHYEIGRSLLSQGKLPLAESHARLAVALDNEYASFHVLMANIYVAELDANSALAEFREALRLDPDGPDAQAIKDNIGMLQKALSQPAQTKKR